MAELYMKSLSSGNKVWMGEKSEQFDVKPKIEPKAEVDDQKDQSSHDGNANQSQNAPISHQLDSVSASVPLAFPLPTPPALPAVSSVVAEGRVTMNGSDSMSLAATDQEKSAADVSNELLKWKEEAMKRESLKDRLLESQGALVAMLKSRNEELELKLRQKEAAEKETEKRTAGVASLESATQTDSLENDKETPMEQRSRAEIAAQKLGVDVEPSNEKCEELERTLENIRKEFDEQHLKYKTVKRRYRAEQKTNTELRRALVVMGGNVKKETKEQQVQLNDAESNEVFTSPLDSVQLEGEKRRQKQQLVMEREEIDGEENERLHIPVSSADPIAAAAVNGGNQQADNDEEQRENDDNMTVTAKERTKSTLAKSAPGASHRRTNIGDRQLILRKGRLPAVASTTRVKKQSGAANSISVASGAFPCAKCPEHLCFASAQVLQKHMERRHSDRHRYPCDQCGQSFTQISNLRTHKKRMHSDGLKPFPCPFCTKRFPMKGDLMAHQRTHTGERPFACGVCQKTFATSTNLRAHERSHSGEQLYGCKYCGKKFTHGNSCYQHQNICLQQHAEK